MRLWKSKIFKLVLVIFLLSFLIEGCMSLKNKEVSNHINSKQNTTKTLTTKQWLEDIDYLNENLPKNHINLYYKTSKNDFQKQINELKTEIPKLNDMQIKFKLKQIVASVGDAHTSMNLDNPEKYYCVGTWWFGNDLRVVSINKEYKDILGMNLIAINNIPIDEILNKINTLISHENSQWLKANNINYLPNPEVLKFFKVTKNDEAEFTFQSDDKKIIKIKICPEKITKDNIISVRDSMPKKPISFQVNSINYYENLYWYKYIPEDKILYFQYNLCYDFNTARVAGFKDYESYPDFREFSNGLIKTINENKIDKFIIDMSHNQGGNSILLDDLITRLSERTNLAETSKVFVIIGRNTFSSGVVNSFHLKVCMSAKLFGEPTGGNANSYGEISTLTLPNSKVTISYSKKFYFLSDNYKEGLIPDIFIEESFKNYQNGIDDVYEAIKNYKN